MTFNNLTQDDAVRIRDILRQLETFEAQQVEDARKARIAIAETWWDTVKPAVPITITEALAVYRFIDDLSKTETKPDRRSLLRGKLKLANEKYKERKRHG